MMLHIARSRPFAFFFSTYRIDARLEVSPEEHQAIRAHRLGSRERTGNCRVKRQIDAAHAIATYAAIRQSQCKRRIGCDVLAEYGETGFGDFGKRLSFGFFHRLFKPLAK